MKPPSLDVHLLPSLVEEAALAGRTAVAVDVLRATTTIVHALAAGARQVVPCLEVEDARRQAAERGGDVLLGGERGGLPIEGFDLGNSPEEYAPERVAGKTILFTTSNGTKAMRRCRAARHILIGAFVNLSAVCHEIATGLDRDESSIDVVCAGTDGEPTREDVLFAGAVADELGRARDLRLNDQAEIARDAWRQVKAALADGTPLAQSLRSSRGARNLIELGQERDVEVAAALDRFDIVPHLDPQSWVIRIPT